MMIQSVQDKVASASLNANQLRVSVLKLPKKLGLPLATEQPECFYRIATLRGGGGTISDVKRFLRSLSRFNLT